MVGDSDNIRGTYAAADGDTLTGTAINMVMPGHTADNQENADISGSTVGTAVENPMDFIFEPKSPGSYTFLPLAITTDFPAPNWQGIPSSQWVTVVVTNPQTPPPPSNLNASCDIVNHIASYSWTGDPSATSYAFTATDNQSGTQWAHTVTDTSYLMNGLYGPSYSWSVAACNGDGTNCSVPVKGTDINCQAAPNLTFDINGLQDTVHVKPGENFYYTWSGQNVDSCVPYMVSYVDDWWAINHADLNPFPPNYGDASSYRSTGLPHSLSDEATYTYAIKCASTVSNSTYQSDTVSVQVACPTGEVDQGGVCISTIPTRCKEGDTAQPTLFCAKGSLNTSNSPATCDCAGGACDGPAKQCPSGFTLKDSTTCVCKPDCAPGYTLITTSDGVECTKDCGGLTCIAGQVATCDDTGNPICISNNVCLPGYIGTWPKCSKPSCEPGQTGTYPDCKTPGSCPTGTTGTWPDCKQVTDQCPDGYTGTYPYCQPPVCSSVAGNVCATDGNIYSQDAACNRSANPVQRCPYGCDRSTNACRIPSPIVISALFVKPSLVQSGTPATIGWAVKNVKSCTVVASDGETRTCAGDSCASLSANTYQTLGIVAQTIFTLDCTPLDGAENEDGSPYGQWTDESATVNIVPTFHE